MYTFPQGFRCWFYYTSAGIYAETLILVYMTWDVLWLNLLSRREVLLEV